MAQPPRSLSLALGQDSNHRRDVLAHFRSGVCCQEGDQQQHSAALTAASEPAPSSVALPRENAMGEGAWGRADDGSDRRVTRTCTVPNMGTHARDGRVTSYRCRQAGMDARTASSERRGPMYHGSCWPCHAMPCHPLLLSQINNLQHAPFHPDPFCRRSLAGLLLPVLPALVLLIPPPFSGDQRETEARHPLIRGIAKK